MHSAAMYDSKMFVFGGVLFGKKGHAIMSDELWCFCLKTREWKNLTPPPALDGTPRPGNVWPLPRAG